MDMTSLIPDFGLGRELLDQSIQRMYPGLFDMDQKSAAERMAEEARQEAVGSLGLGPAVTDWVADDLSSNR